MVFVLQCPDQYDDRFLTRHVRILSLGLLAYLFGSAACGFPGAAAARVIRYVSCLVVLWCMLQCALCSTIENKGLRVGLASSYVYFILRGLDLFLLGPFEADVPRWNAGLLGDCGLPKSFTETLRYAFALATSFRGIGWNWQVQRPRTSSTRRSSQARKSWLLEQCSQTLVMLIIFHGCEVYMTRTIVHSQRNGQLWEALPYLYRLHLVPFFGLAAFSSIKIALKVADILRVILSSRAIEEIDRYPSLRAFHVTRLSDFWANGWHRFFRRAFTGTGSRVFVWVYDRAVQAVDHLRDGTQSGPISKPSKSSRARQAIFVFGAFFASGVMHHIGILSVDGTSNYATLLAFVVQPFGFIAEHFFISRCRKGRKRTMVDHILGRLWVLCFLCVTFEPMLNEWIGKGVIVSQAAFPLWGATS